MSHLVSKNDFSSNEAKEIEYACLLDSFVTVLYSVGHAIRLDVWKMREQLHALFTKKIIIVFFIKDLKARYPHKDWAQIRGRLLGVCNLTNEDESLNQVLNKVCLVCNCCL